jgi:uncharacterized protein (DUF362 family)
MMKSRVAIRDAKNADINSLVAELIEFCGGGEKVAKGTRVVIKPNLCCEIPEKIPAANTDILILDAVCAWLADRGADVTIGESDGTRYPAEMAFENTGVYPLRDKYGVKVVNFTKAEQREVDHPLLKGWPLPADLLDAEVVIDLPVLKTHALTLITGTVKNLWGCVPRYDRILIHQHLDRLLADLTDIFKPTINVMDGLLCVEGRGPVNGVPRRLDILLASEDPVALDATAARLVGLEPKGAKHLVLADESGYGTMKEEEIEIDGDFDAHRCEFEPPLADLPIRMMNYMTRYRFFTYHILLNNHIFYPVRAMVKAMRRVTTW